MRSVWKRFIVLEGLDGAGTTTQAQLLGNQGTESPWTTCEPTGLPTGRIIRDILEHRLAAEPETLARLFTADRHEHLFGPDGIRSHLDRGEWVVTDRYYFSSLAYQSVDCGYEKVALLNRDFPLPEYLIYIDVPLDICRQRRTGRREDSPEKDDLFEKDDFLRKAQGMYDRAFSEIPGDRIHFHRVSGEASPEDLHRRILGILGW